MSEFLRCPGCPSIVSVEQRKGASVLAEHFLDDNPGNGRPPDAERCEYSRAVVALRIAGSRPEPTDVTELLLMRTEQRDHYEQECLRLWEVFRQATEQLHWTGALLAYQPSGSLVLAQAALKGTGFNALQVRDYLRQVYCDHPAEERRLVKGTGDAPMFHLCRLCHLAVNVTEWNPEPSALVPVASQDNQDGPTAIHIRGAVISVDGQEIALRSFNPAAEAALPAGRATSPGVCISAIRACRESWIAGGVRKHVCDMDPNHDGDCTCSCGDMLCIPSSAREAEVVTDEADPCRFTSYPEGLELSLNGLDHDDIQYSRYLVRWHGRLLGTSLRLLGQAQQRPDVWVALREQLQTYIKLQYRTGGKVFIGGARVGVVLQTAEGYVSDGHGHIHQTIWTSPVRSYGSRAIWDLVGWYFSDAGPGKDHRHPEPEGEN